MPRRNITKNPMLFEIVFVGDLSETWYYAPPSQYTDTKNWYGDHACLSSYSALSNQSTAIGADTKDICPAGKYAVQIREFTVGLDFVKKVRDLFGEIPLNQISCVVPFPVYIDVSILMGYRYAMEMLNDDLEMVFKHHNQLFYKVDPGELNAFIYVDVCRRLWTTSDTMSVEHDPPDSMVPPFEDNLNYVYYPCVNIDPKLVIEWWKSNGCPTGTSSSSTNSGQPWYNFPQRYDLLYGFYNTKFFPDEPRSSFLTSEEATPVQSPHEHMLADYWTTGYIPITKCIKWHIETDTTSNVGISGQDPWSRELPRCNCGQLLYMWPRGSKTYKELKNDFSEYSDFFYHPLDDDADITGIDISTNNPFIEIDGYTMAHLISTPSSNFAEWDYDTSISDYRSNSAEWPGRFYKDYEETGEFGFKGWQMYCCQKFITKWFWVDNFPYMNQFLLMWFRDTKTIEIWNELDDEDYEYWPYYFQKKYADQFGTGMTGATGKPGGF